MFIVIYPNSVIADKIENMLKSTWQGILGGVLSSYHKLLLVNKLATSEVKTFWNLAKKHKSSLQVLSSVAEYLDSISGYACFESIYF